MSDLYRAAPSLLASREESPGVAHVQTVTPSIKKQPHSLAIVSRCNAGWRAGIGQGAQRHDEAGVVAQVRKGQVPQGGSRSGEAAELARNHLRC